MKSYVNSMLVSFTAVFWDVTQHSPKETAAHNRTTFLSIVLRFANRSNQKVRMTKMSHENVDVADNLDSVLVMEEETPKKIVDESWKCFTCLSPCTSNQRFYIFGSSAHNFSEIIKSLLNIEVKTYAMDNANNKLFVCKTVCYSQLLKFQRAVEKVNEVKKEIQATFQRRPRAKRLLRSPDGEETRENQSSPSN